LNDAQEAFLNAQRAGRGETGHLNLGLTASATFHPIVRSLIRTYRSAYPGVGLTLTEDTTAQLLGLLNDGRLDLALLRPGTHSFAGVALHPIASEQFKAVLPVAHPLAKRRRIPLSALAGESFILIPRVDSPMLHDEILSACRHAGFEPLLGQQAPQLSSVVNLVSAEFGVSIVPASVGQIQAEGVVYLDITDAEAVTQLALASREADASAKVNNFLALVKQASGGAAPTARPTRPGRPGTV
jgi:DNA-binding transcriptional LysR family regulator